MISVLLPIAAAAAAALLVVPAGARPGAVRPGRPPFTGELGDHEAAVTVDEGGRVAKLHRPGLLRAEALLATSSSPTPSPRHSTNHDGWPTTPRPPAGRAKLAKKHKKKSSARQQSAYELADIKEEAPTRKKPAFIVLPLLGKCSANMNSATAFPVRMEACDDVKAQNWFMEGSVLRSALDDRCLDHDTATGQLRLRGCTTDSSQHWQLDAKGRLRSLSELRRGKCVEVDLHDNAVGNWILKKCASVGNQEFKFRRPKKVEGS